MVHGSSHDRTRRGESDQCVAPDTRALPGKMPCKMPRLLTPLQFREFSKKKGPSNLLICCRIVQERKVYLLIDMLTRGNSISSETPSSHHPLLSSLSWTLSALPSSPRHGAQHLRRLEQEAQKRCYSSLLRRVQAVSLLHRSTFSLSLIDFSLASSCAVTGIFPAAPVSSAGVVRSVRTVRHPLLLPLLPRRNRTRGF